MDTTTSPRRVLATRSRWWAAWLSHRLHEIGITPNAVSMIGLGFAAATTVAFVVAPGCTPNRAALVLALATAGIQLRLLCNLLDGMLAIEEGLRTRTGDIFNELPDRIADVLILVGAGYSVRAVMGGVAIGWAAAVLALFTAYVRVLSGSLGATQRFLGPMAKQHRMFTLTLATGGAVIERAFDQSPRSLYIGLMIIAIGSAVTTIRRTRYLFAEVSSR